jgi:glycosyltransferase involved in cell wall biosynthesis
MQPDRPLLTIAIPTYNRQTLLSTMLSVLEPQIAAHPEVEVFISDNASSDGTEEAVRPYLERNPRIRYQRHSENIGPDGNFVSCLHSARGKYFWLFSDDDIIVPGALDELMSHLATDEFDLVYMTSYGFRNDFIAEKVADPLGRHFHRIASAGHFTKVVNIMFTFISGMIINKERFDEMPHEDPATFINSNLIQLGWTLPLLRQHRRSLVLWTRPVAGLLGNTGGYAIGEVFGKQLVDVANRCLPDRPDLVAIILNFTISRWLPAMLYSIRCQNSARFALGSARASFRRAYGNNIRYWICTWPVLALPLPLAGIWSRAVTAANKVIYMATVPGFWRKEI